MAKYDEDLHDNPFFIAFQEKHSDLFTLAADNCWMVCIPRIGSLSRMKLNRNDIENHIIIPNTSDVTTRGEESELKNVGNEPSGGTYFTSLNKKHLLIQGESIFTGQGYKDARQVKILFDEHFFNSKDQSYQVLCIEQPLEGGSDDHSTLFVSMDSIEDCIAFLWSEPGSDRVKKIIDSYCASCRLEGRELTPQNIQTNARSVYENSLQEIGRLPHVRKLHTASSKTFFHLACETYVLNKLHPLIFRSLCKIELGDTAVNTVTRRISDITFYDLGIQDEFKGSIARAKSCLQHLNQCLSPLEKSTCFKKTLITLAKLSSDIQTEGLTADELLPMLVYLVVKSDIPNWRSNLYYIQHFHFSKVGNEEFLYYLTSFEAAVEYIATGELEKNVGRDFRKPKIPDDSGMDEIGKANMSILNSFFQSICSGDIQAVQKIILKSREIPDGISQELCHPLCDCNKCAPIVQIYHDHPSHVTVHSKDLLLRNGLHYAALFGHQQIVQWLLERTDLKQEIDEVDCNQQSALHLACFRGNQKCVLLLLSDESTVNKVDKCGNTPLHMACSHGHVECVKALVFHKVKCNMAAVNDQGDTPLHLAARWNFTSIVSLLLEHGANPKIKNYLKETPDQTTWNSHVFLMLRTGSTMDESNTLAGGGEGEDSVTSATVRLKHSTLSERGAGGNPIGGGSRVNQRYKRRSTLTSDTERQMQKLFRAIEDNDFGMVKYLFGWQEPGVQETSDRSSQEFCHPLCQCEKCSKLRKGHPLLSLTVNACDAVGNTPLHKAALRGQRQIVEALLEHGAAKNVPTKDEFFTPLHLACQYNHKDVVMILIENGADLNRNEKRGNTPLHFCCNNGHMESATLLLIHGADVTVSNDRGDTPLHNAARWNHATLVRELILYGALYSVTNKEGKTPLDLTTDEEVYTVIDQATNGEIPTGSYVPVTHKCANSPPISDDDYEHL